MHSWNIPISGTLRNRTFKKIDCLTSIFYRMFCCLLFIQQSPFISAWNISNNVLSKCDKSNLLYSMKRDPQWWNLMWYIASWRFQLLWQSMNPRGSSCFQWNMHLLGWPSARPTSIPLFFVFFSSMKFQTEGQWRESHFSWFLLYFSSISQVYDGEKSFYHFFLRNAICSGFYLVVSIVHTLYLRCWYWSTWRKCQAQNTEERWIH